jgi:alpha-amylase
VKGFPEPLAHALILLHLNGHPSILYDDLYGMEGDNLEPPSCGDKLANLILARKYFAYGELKDY